MFPRLDVKKFHENTKYLSRSTIRFKDTRYDFEKSHLIAALGDGLGCAKCCEDPLRMGISVRMYFGLSLNKSVKKKLEELSLPIIDWESRSLDCFSNSFSGNMEWSGPLETLLQEVRERVEAVSDSFDDVDGLAAVLWSICCDDLMSILMQKGSIPEVFCDCQSLHLLPMMLGFTQLVSVMPLTNIIAHAAGDSIIVKDGKESSVDLSQHYGSRDLKDIDDLLKGFKTGGGL